MKDEIMSMLDDMNDEQIRRVLDYTTNEYDEENFEEHALDLLQRTWAELTIAKLKKALEEREDFPTELISIVKEEGNRIVEETGREASNAEKEKYGF